MSDDQDEQIYIPPASDVPRSFSGLAAIRAERPESYWITQRTREDSEGSLMPLTRQRTTPQDRSAASRSVNPQMIAAFLGSMLHPPSSSNSITLEFGNGNSMSADPQVYSFDQIAHGASEKLNDILGNFSTVSNEGPHMLVRYKSCGPLMRKFEQSDLDFQVIVPDPEAFARILAEAPESFPRDTEVSDQFLPGADAEVSECISPGYSLDPSSAASKPDTSSTSSAVQRRPNSDSNGSETIPCLREELPSWDVMVTRFNKSINSKEAFVKDGKCQSEGIKAARRWCIQSFTETANHLKRSVGRATIHKDEVLTTMVGVVNCCSRNEEAKEAYETWRQAYNELPLDTTLHDLVPVNKKTQGWTYQAEECFNGVLHY